MSGIPESEMGGLLPGRGVLYVQPYEHEGGPAIEVACDCATTTIVVLDIEGAVIEPREIAVTCDGCGTAHWLTLFPRPEGDHA